MILYNAPLLYEDMETFYNGGVVVPAQFFGKPLQWNLNRVTDKLVGNVPTLDAQGAANVWAGTSGLDLLGALNFKAGTNGLGLNAVCNLLAGTDNYDSDLASAYFE